MEVSIEVPYRRRLEDIELAPGRCPGLMAAAQLSLICTEAERHAAPPTARKGRRKIPGEGPGRSSCLAQTLLFVSPWQAGDVGTASCSSCATRSARRVHTSTGSKRSRTPDYTPDHQAFAAIIARLLSRIVPSALLSFATGNGWAAGVCQVGEGALIPAPFDVRQAVYV